MSLPSGRMATLGSWGMWRGMQSMICGVRRQSTQAKLSAASPASSAGNEITWDEFFRLRKQRRTFGLVASVPSTLLGLGAGFAQLATVEIDPGQTILGLDPLIVYGVGIVGCGGLGWLLGPLFGQGIWKLIHRRKAGLMAQREKTFFDHVRRYRVDPSRQSMSNPVPDFYGEKIDSVKAYRRWLRDQKVYNRKASWGETKGRIFTDPKHS